MEKKKKICCPSYGCRLTKLIGIVELCWGVSALFLFNVMFQVEDYQS